MTKEFLEQKNVTFTEKNVATDQAAAKEMIKKSGGYMGVPVIVVSDEGKEEIIVGFDEEQLTSVLGLA
jgi:glutaredoxin